MQQLSSGCLSAGLSCSDVPTEARYLGAVESQRSQQDDQENEGHQGRELPQLLGKLVALPADEAEEVSLMITMQYRPWQYPAWSPKVRRSPIGPMVELL